MSHAPTRSQEYDRLFQTAELRFPREDYPAFCAWLNVPAGARDLRGLDIACGLGFFLEAAVRLAPQVAWHGVDFSTVAVARASERVPSATISHASASDLPFDDASFDYCVNLGSLEHFEDPERALAEMRRVLKPTGKAMVIVPNLYYLGTIWRVLAYGDADTQEQEGMTAFRTVNDWSRLFARANLDIVGLRGYNGEHHIAWYFERRDGVITDAERRWRSALDTFVKPLIPLNLSQCFVYHLRRQPGD